MDIVDSRCNHHTSGKSLHNTDIIIILILKVYTKRNRLTVPPSTALEHVSDTFPNIRVLQPVF